MKRLLVPLVLLCAAAGPSSGRVIKVTAKKFEFSPATIDLKVGEPVTIELRTLDRKHGFAVPDLDIDAVILPGKPTLVKLVPDKPGTFPVHCSVFCGSGHEDMGAQIVVRP